MRKLSTKTAAVLGAAALAVAGTGVAYAYWSTAGTGTGTADASAGAANLTVAEGTAPTGLAPGVASVTVPGTITNNAVNKAYVKQLVVTITGVDSAHSTGCSAADFGLTTTSAVVAKTGASQSVTLPLGQELSANGGSMSFPSVQIGFADDSGNGQDGCKGAVPALSFQVT